MSGFLTQVLAAARRIDAGQRLLEPDVAVIRPLLHNLAAEINRTDPIRFVQVGNGFVIDTTTFPALLGFQYIRALLMAPGDLISCGRLNPAAVSTSQQKMLVPHDIRRLVNRAKELREIIDAVQSAGAINPEDVLIAIQERDSIEKYLNESTRKGRSKSFVSESEKVRQSVNKAINLSLDKIEGKAETRLIGEHLRTNLKMGYRCAYFGEWKWKF